MLLYKVRSFEILSSGGTLFLCYFYKVQSFEILSIGEESDMVLVFEFQECTL